MKVSIIIPRTTAYADFYADAVESVQTQEREAEIITIKADGLSVGRATNIGVRQSSGEYVMRLDCDDWLHPFALQVMVNYLDAHPQFVAVYSDYLLPNEGHPPIIVEQCSPPHPGCMLVRRGAYDRIKGFDETLTRQEGTDFYYRLHAEGPIAHIPIGLWYYRQHDGQMSNQHNEVVQARHEVNDIHEKEQTRILAIIPARGGAKGIPRKNLIKLDGLPLVTHAIRMAKKSKHDMMIALSTEDEEIAQVGLDEGIAVLDRDPADATDEVNLITVAKHGMEAMDGIFKADIIVTIQPTAPWMPTEALDGALDRLLAAPDLDAVVSMSEITGRHPYRLYSRTGEADFTPFFPAQAEAYLQRQDRIAAYQFSGMYCRRRHLLEEWTGEGFALGNWQGEVVPMKCGIDIDNRFDLYLAEAVRTHWEEF